MFDPYPDDSSSNNQIFDPRQKAVHSDFVEGEKISLGDISSSTGVAVGRDTQSGVSPQVSAAGGLDELFQRVYRLVQLRPAEPGVEKDELIGLVRRIEEEANKRADASQSRLASWMDLLKVQAKDVYQGTLEALSSPFAAPELRKMAFQMGEGAPPGRGKEGVEALKEELQAGTQPEPVKARLSAALDELAQEIARGGESADLGMIVHALDEITTSAPEMRLPLSRWLVDSPDIPRPVRIIARKFLT